MLLAHNTPAQREPKRLDSGMKVFLSNGGSVRGVLMQIEKKTPTRHSPAPEPTGLLGCLCTGSSVAFAFPFQRLMIIRQHTDVALLVEARHTHNRDCCRSKRPAHTRQGAKILHIIARYC